MKNKIPKLRFSEFRDRGEWIEKRLGDIGKILMCKRIMKNQTSGKGEIPFYKIRTFGKKKADAYISKKIFEKYKEKYPFPNKGDILISASGTIGKLVIYDGQPAYFQDSNIVWLGNNESIVLNIFLNYIYQNVNWVTDGNTISRLYNENIKKIKIFFPENKQEQQKIANTLKSLDDLIEAQSKKVEKLKEYKKGLMQKLFPADGKKVPEIRFKEFSGEWVEKRLGDIAEIFKGRGLSKSQLDVNGDYLCIHYGELFTQYKEVINKVKNKTFEFRNSVKSIKNDVLMPTSDVTPTGLAKASCLKLSNVIIGGDILIIRTGIYGDFLSRYIILLKNKVLKLVSGTTVFHLYANDLKKLKIYIPTLPEQQKIADTLSSLDKLIEAESKKVEVLKKHKKGLMQQLFVGEDE